MFVGQIQANPYAGNRGISAVRPHMLFGSKKTILPQYDRAEIGSHFQRNEYSGIYTPNSIQMRTMEYAPCPQAAPDSRLQQELLPPSERPAYTEEDALINQYMKQL